MDKARKNCASFYTMNSTDLLDFPHLPGKAGDHKRNHGWDYEGLKRFQDLGAIIRNDKNRGEEEQLHEGWTEIFYNIVAEQYMEQEQQTDAREEPEQVVQELSLWFD